MSFPFYLVAGTFALFSGGLFAGYAMYRRRGLLLGGATYGLGAVAAFALQSWWPLTIALVGAIALRALGLDPGLQAARERAEEDQSDRRTA
jgi:hypothetical protein